jgi:hypothetical protein
MGTIVMKISENLGFGLMMLVAVLCLLGIARAVYYFFAG